MAVNKNRRMTLMAPFEQMTGKFALQRETCANMMTVGSYSDKVCYTYFGARIVNHRGKKGLTQLMKFYYRKNPRVSDITQEEATCRVDFKTANAMALADSKSLQYIPGIRKAYSENTAVEGVTPSSGDYTVRGWIMAVYYNQKKEKGTFTQIDWTQYA